MSLDAEQAERLRLEMEAKRSGSSKAGKQRGPVDSGKGVRIQVCLLAASICNSTEKDINLTVGYLQGGRVYDSKHGVTCHW